MAFSSPYYAWLDEVDDLIDSLSPEARHKLEDSETAWEEWFYLGFKPNEAVDIELNGF